MGPVFLITTPILFKLIALQKLQRRKSVNLTNLQRKKKMRNHNTTLNTIFMTFKHSFSNKILAYFTPSSMKGIFSLSLSSDIFFKKREEKVENK